MKPFRASAEPNNRQVFRVGMLMVLAAAMPIEAQDPKDRPPAPPELRIVQAEGRDLVALPSHADVPDVLQPASGGLAAYSFDAGSRRIHVVEFEGETFRAATPLEGSRSWIAFDPGRRAFASLLPSIRVELQPELQLDAIASELGSTGVTVFETLGFAIIDLPEDLHPAEAVARLRNLPGEPRAAVRLRRPRIEWR
ncbi:MAG: hypothetical protein OXP28_03030 [Gammaproteobacteria bacterium]|nr:hypothetical protein [Gammaproteobacteria bacterium]